MCLIWAKQAMALEITNLATTICGCTLRHMTWSAKPISKTQHSGTLKHNQVNWGQKAFGRVPGVPRQPMGLDLHACGQDSLQHVLGPKVAIAHGSHRVAAKIERPVYQAKLSHISSRGSSNLSTGMEQTRLRPYKDIWKNAGFLLCLHLVVSGSAPCAYLLKSRIVPADAGCACGFMCELLGFGCAHSHALKAVQTKPCEFFAILYGLGLRTAMQIQGLQTDLEILLLRLYSEPVEEGWIPSVWDMVREHVPKVS